jgi:radical SAM protein with 4Fe4S-binding SPASM domain
MIESVEEYMREVPGRMKIRLSPETFRSSRPDPVGRVVMPRGFEGRLLAPRRNDWIILDPQAAVVWGLNRARIVLPAASGPALRSRAIPVEPSRELVFKTRIGLTGGPVRLMVVDDQRRTVAEVALADTNGRMIPLDLPIETGQAAWLSIVIAGEGAPATMDVDFERLRKPAPFVSDAFHIPPSRRWEACAPDAAIGWDEATLTVRSPTGGRPYLLKSYAIPCPRRALVEIPVFVGVARGAIEIGVLDASSAAYLQSFGFAEGADACVIFFNTGENDAVRLVVSAAPNQPVEATVQWRTPRIVPRAEIGADPVGPPGASQWAACAPGLQVGREGDSLSLTWRGAGSPYLLKSNKIRCRAGDRVKVAMAVEVSEGQLAVGVVGDGGAAWLAIRILDEGAHRVELEFDTGANDELSFVVTAVDGESVAARVWLSEPGFGQTPAAATPAGGAFARPNLEPAAVVAEFRIPPGARWGRCTAEAKVDWRGDALGLSSTTGGRPYLLKSPAIRCPRDSVVEIPVQVEVSHGMIEINALNPSGRVNLASFRFCEGRTATAVFFNTRSNEAIRLGISAAPDRPVDATIRWGKPALVREGDGDAEPIRLPSAPQWAACVPAASLRREGDRLFLSWRGAGSPYLLKSNKIRCRPGRPASARAVIDVTEGPLNIGLLDARDASWLITRTLGGGAHEVCLDFDPGANDEVSFVLFAANGASVEASVVVAGGDLRDAFASASTRVSAVAGDGARIGGALDGGSFAPDAPVSPPARPEIAVLAAAESSARQVTGASPLEGAAPPASPPSDAKARGASADGGTRPDRLLRQVGNWLSRGGARYYCQKPWTDMNNFTVDGRMDVCCIATGASQEAYQIGNLNRQNFQEIWNGPVARKFRRTVNSANKLPPCARCPMSYAYQGFLFDPAHTRDATVGRVANRLAKTKLARCGPYISKMGDYLVNRVLFRGFKR